MKRGKQWDIKWTCIKGRPQNRKRNEPVHNSAYFTHTHTRTLENRHLFNVHEIKSQFPST